MKHFSLKSVSVRGAFCQFSFRWIYYYGSNKPTGKETGNTNLCGAEVIVVFWFGTAAQNPNLKSYLRHYFYFLTHKDWRDPRLSTTETTVLNPDHSEQSPALQNNNYPTPTTDGHSVESGSTSSVRSRTNKRYVNWIQNLHWKLGQLAPSFGSILLGILRDYGLKNIFFRNKTFCFKR